MAVAKIVEKSQLGEIQDAVSEEAERNPRTQTWRDR